MLCRSFWKVGYFYLCVCAYVSLCAPCECSFSQRPEDGVGYSGTGITGGNESHDVGARSQIQVPWKSSRHSLLKHLPSLLTWSFCSEWFFYHPTALERIFLHSIWKVDPIIAGLLRAIPFHPSLRGTSAQVSTALLTVWLWVDFVPPPSSLPIIPCFVALRSQNILWNSCQVLFSQETSKRIDFKTSFDWNCI